MAVAGTVAGSQRSRFDPALLARRLRRWIVLPSIAVFAWFLLQFGTMHVPAGMDTMPGAPPGSWCLVDRWSVGLRVGSDVFVDGPAGLLLSRVVALTDDTVSIEHPNPRSRHPDSRQFGPLPRRAVRSTVMTVLAAGGADARR
jgi:type IV secretory pathway protease TraF